MAVLLVFLAATLVFLAVLNSKQEHTLWVAVGESIIESLVIMGVFVWFSIEILSLFNGIHYGPFVFAYVVLILAIVAVSFRRRRDILHQASSRAGELLSFLAERWKALLPIAVLYVAPLLFIGFYYPPNNWDSMAYHLPRIEHWIQNRNILPYPTSYVPQVFNQPFAEYTIMHLRLLSGSDYFDCLVQFFSMLGCFAAVGLITREITQSTKASVISALLMLAIPMGILQSTSTQNDYVAAFFVCAFVFFGIRAIRSAARAWTFSILIGCSVGLAALTKLTAAVYIFPFAIWFAFALVRRKGFGYLTRVVGGAILLAAIVNTPYYVHNIESSGHLFGAPQIQSMLGVRHHFMVAAVTDGVKNIAMQFSSPLPPLNHLIERSVHAFSTRLYSFVGAPQDNPAFQMPNFNFQEDIAGNALVVLLFVFAVVGLFARRRPNEGPLFLVTICILAGLLLFSAGFRWQLYSSRYMLSLYVLSCIISGSVLARFGRGIVRVVTVIVILGALPYVYFNYMRPILPVYSLAATYRELAHYLPMNIQQKNVQSLPAADRLEIARAYKLENGVYVRHKIVAGELRGSVYHILVRNQLAQLPQGTPLARSRFADYFANRQSIGRNYAVALSDAYREQIPRAVGLIIPGDAWEYPVWSWFRSKKAPLPYIADVQPYVGYQPPKQNSYSHIAFDWTIVEGNASPGKGWQVLARDGKVTIYTHMR